MASLVSSNPKKTHCHARSISFPSRSTQLSEFQEQLCRLQDSKTPTSSSSISEKINGLTDLYSSVENLLRLPSAQRFLTQECQNNSVNELLDGLLKLLDMCSAAEDALVMSRDSTQELQSVLRRKRGDICGLMSAIQEYQSQRKMVRKGIHKASRDIPKLGNKKSSSSSSEIVSILKEVESVTSIVFESLFSVIYGSKSQSLVSKLLVSKRISCDETLERGLVEKVDGELVGLMISQKGKKKQSYSCFQVENTQKLLVELESSFQDIEEGLECLHRQLIKTRVSLLNLLNC